MINSVRYAFRQAKSQLGYSTTILLTVSLTIGAATAVFTLFDAALLRPLPFPQPERMVDIGTYLKGNPEGHLEVSLHDFQDIRSRSRTLESAAAFLTFTNPLTGIGAARPVRMTFASASFFDVLKVRPVVGRAFTPEEDVLGGPVLKVVIANSLWQDLFGASPSAIGRRMQIRGQSYEVIGVMPPGFSYPDRSIAWVPLMARYSSYKAEWWKRRDARYHRVVARLRDGVSLEQAGSDLDAINGVLRSEHPDESREIYGRIRPLRDAEVGEAKAYVNLVAGAALLLLLLGCVNVANLMVARSLARERDIAVRLALGSTRWPIIGQLLAETLLLSLTGGVLGVLLAMAGVAGFQRLLPAQTPEWMRLVIDWRVLFFAIAVAVATALAATLLPAMQQLRTNLSDVMKQGTRGSSEGMTFAAWARRGLVVVQISLSLILLAGAGLMVRSFQKVMDSDTGLRADHLVVVESGRYVPNVEKQAAVRAYTDVYRGILTALQQMPGVIAVGGTHTLPFVSKAEQRPMAEMFTLRRATRDQAFKLPFRGADVTPGYFNAMSIPLLDGRDFTELDGMETAPVVVISERTAATLFPGQRAVGQKLRFGINEAYDPWSTVIGVVGSTKFHPAERLPGYEVYWSYRQYPGPGMNYVIRTAADPETMKQRIAQGIQGMDPETSIERITTMEAVVADSVWRRKLWSVILSLFGIIATVLAFVGLYGIMSFTVSQESRAIGIRLAVGATPGTIRTWVLMRGLKLTVGGMAAGLLFAALLAAQLGDLLYEVQAVDPLALATACGATLLAAVLACLVPAIRATLVDPVTVLRNE